MERYAIIENGIVDNIVVADSEFAAEQGWIACETDIATGWSYDGGEFSAPVVPPEEIRAAIRPVSMRQARLALLAAGKLADVDTALNAMPSPQKEAARIEWEYAAEVRRDAPLIAALGGALGLSEDQIDALFAAAAVL